MKIYEPRWAVRRVFAKWFDEEFPTILSEIFHAVKNGEKTFYSGSCKTLFVKTLVKNGVFKGEVFDGECISVGGYHPCNHWSGVTVNDLQFNTAEEILDNEIFRSFIYEKLLEVKMRDCNHYLFPYYNWIGAMYKEYIVLETPEEIKAIIKFRRAPLWGPFFYDGPEWEQVLQKSPVSIHRHGLDGVVVFNHGIISRKVFIDYAKSKMGRYNSWFHWIIEHDEDAPLTMLVVPQ